MDFSDKLKSFTNQIQNKKENLNTEEATKTSLILPFFHLLGYDIFNPLEFVPEFVADVGTKRGEKVDYAIMRNNEPIIIIEAKAINVELNSKHINQLFRYFAVTKAKFAILTNGIKYQFFSDLEESNKMDLTPFLEIDLLNLQDSSVSELEKFQKDCFDIKGILDSALNLKYLLRLKTAIAEQIQSPSDQFIRLLIKNIYTGVKTQSILDKFRELTLIAMDDYLNDLVLEKSQCIEPPTPVIDSNTTISKTKNSNFLPEELETLEYIKQMIGANDIEYRKTSRYAYMYTGNTSSWICRVAIQKGTRLLTLHKFENVPFYEHEYYFDEVELLEQIKELIRQVYKLCKNN